MCLIGLPRCIYVHYAFTCKPKVGTKIEEDTESLELEL